MNEKQLDLLKKLVALAHNNPNDNEANLAARRACKMLAEHKFELTTGIKSVNVRPVTYNDVTRSREPEFKSKTQEPVRPHTPPRGTPWTWENVYNTPFWDELFKGTKSQRSPGGETWRDRDPNYGYTNIPKKCSKCGEEVDTTWIGPLDKFVCVNCKWKGMP